MSTDAAPETKPKSPRGFPILSVVLAILAIVACGAYLMERNTHEKEKAALEAELLQARTEAEGLKNKLRALEHDNVAKPIGK